MVKKSPIPWLADFVSAEIRQVIDWKRTLGNNIKPDPDSRFDDDGSNFRSVATDLPTHCSLQLIEIILAKDQPTVVVSDGHTRMKARLSQDAVAVLEDEAGAKFTKDMLNDVFQPALLTVISTPLGTPDGFIQLYIDGIEYEHHLRRSEGQPSPVEENESVQILLDDIRKIRCAGLPSSDPHDFEPAGVHEPALDSPRSTISQRLREPSRLPTSATPVRNSARKSSPASRINDTQVLNSAIQTQRVISRKKAGPNLDRDGFEVESGLNLDRPLQAASNDAPDTNAGRSALAPNAQSSHLLGLLGGKIGGKRSREESPPLHRSPVVVAESPSNAVQGDDSAGHLTTASGKDAQHLSSTAPKQTQASLRSSGNASVPYGRRKIPVNQWNLLDRKDSWLPSMPGQSFPSPNVPIEVLTKWNALMKNAPESLRMSQATDAAVEAVPDDEVDSSREESEDGSDSDKEFGPSQWGSSPPARAVELPPDSSFESVVRGSQQDELRVAPPRAMPTARTAASAATLRNSPPPKPAGSASREEYGSWERSARQDGPIHPPRGPRSSREDHGSWERSAMRDDAGHPPRGPRSYLAEFSSPARSQPTRPSQTRYQDQSSRFERPSPRRLHGDDAATIYDGSRSRPQSSLRERRPSSAHSPQRRPSSQVMSDRTIDQSPRRSIAGRSPPGVWTTTQTGEESPRRRPVMNGNATAMSPPTGRRTMALDSYRPSYAETPSRPSITQSQLSVDRPVRASPFPNVPMVGRRKSGAPPHSSPRGPTANTPNGHVYRNDNLSKPEESRPPTSSHRSVIPGTQLAEPPSHPAKDAYDDRPAGTHEPPREQHPDERYREVRREHTWHYKRRDWVKEFYHPDPSGDVPFEIVFHTYRINHKTKSGKNVKNDHALTIESFTAAVQDAFPDDDTTQPLDMRFRPLKAAKRKGHMSKGGANDRTRDPSPSEPDTTTTHADQPRRANGVLQTNGSAGQNQEGQTGSREQEGPEEGTSTSARNPREGAASTQTAGAGPAGAGGGGGTELGVSARQRRNNVPNVGRLAREWLKIRPGGAFAGPQQQQQQQQQQQGQTVRRRIDVLGWDV